MMETSASRYDLADGAIYDRQEFIDPPRVPIAVIDSQEKWFNLVWKGWKMEGWSWMPFDKSKQIDWRGLGGNGMNLSVRRTEINSY
ncbi:hypothetical protein TNCV_10631 [Trichonephila clavipes]|nr:hypothetical protein TNCV_10631 [Trichonephila clavipes]